MDLTKTDQLNLDFDDITINLSDTTTTSITGGYIGIWDSTTYTIPNNHNTISIAPSTWTNTSPSWTITDSDIIGPQSAKIQLKGEDADIMINDRSLMQILDGIEQRLGLLKCREDLESEWSELKALGDQYREMARQLEEKTQMWNALKKMPPVEL